MEDAKKEYQRLGEEKDRLAGDIRGCEKDQEQGQKEQKDLSGEIYRMKREYSEQCLQHLELEKPMLEEYERLREKAGGKAKDTSENKQKDNVEYHREKTGQLYGLFPFPLFFTAGF